jgi:hypothetical protein
MKTTARDLTLAIARIDSKKVRLVMFVITVAMFALAAGAPECSGGVIR